MGFSDAEMQIKYQLCTLKRNSRKGIYSGALEMTQHSNFLLSKALQKYLEII